MSILQAVVVIILLIFYLKNNPGEPAKPNPDKLKVEPKEEKHHSNITPSIVKKRQKNAHLINECIYQMNHSENRASIVEWKFKDDSTDEIYFRFMDNPRLYEGKVFFIYDLVIPRVSRIRYVEDNETKFIRGYIVKSFTQDQLYNKFAKDKQDKERLAYLNEVSMKALIEESELNILEYQRITEKEFTQTFGKNEMKSLIKLLKEEFKEVKQTDIPWILSVTAFDEPQEDYL